MSCCKENFSRNSSFELSQQEINNKKKPSFSLSSNSFGENKQKKQIEILALKENRISDLNENLNNFEEKNKIEGNKI